MQMQILRLTTPEPTPNRCAFWGPWYVRGPRSLRMTGVFICVIGGIRWPVRRNADADSSTHHPRTYPKSLRVLGPMVRSGPPFAQNDGRDRRKVRRWRGASVRGGGVGRRDADSSLHQTRTYRKLHQTRTYPQSLRALGHMVRSGMRPGRDLLRRGFGKCHRA